MGETPQRLAKEASLLNLWGLSPATIKSVAALSVPMPGKETNSGAACATSRSRCASSSAISSREPRNGGPPNGARTWWPCGTSSGSSAEAETGTGSDEFLGGKLA